MTGNKIRPLHDRVIVKRLPEEEVTKGGIIIPDSAKEKPIQGEVVAVGPGKTLDNGKTVAPDVAVGQRDLSPTGMFGAVLVYRGGSRTLVSPYRLESRGAYYFFGTVLATR